MEYFLSSRKPNLIYKLYLLSFKKNSELKYNKKLKFLYLKNYKMPSLRYIVFFLSNILSGKIFDKNNRANISYRNIKIGNHVISYTYRNIKSYKSISYFYFNLIKNFFIAGCFIRTSEIYLKKYRFKSVYLDHLMYLNGIYYQVFAKNKKIIYSNNYPKSTFKIDFTKGKKKYINPSEAHKLQYLERNLSNNEKKKIETLKKKYMKQSHKFIPWLKNTKYNNLKINSKIKLHDYQYIIYPHAFTDAQLMDGFDGFETSYDWLLFTLEFMKKNKINAIIKGHPNFYKKELGILSLWDKEIFEIIEKKYRKNKNFYFINKSIDNLSIINQLNKKCIALTHNGSVILELSLHNIKTISSSKGPWAKKFKVSNQWSNINEYKNLLSKNWSNLNYSNREGINKLYHQLYFNKFSFHGKNSIHKIIRGSLKKSNNLIKHNSKKVFSTDVSSKNLSYQEKIFEKSFPIESQKKFINTLSQGVENI